MHAAAVAMSERTLNVRLGLETFCGCNDNSACLASRNPITSRKHSAHSHDGELAELIPDAYDLDLDLAIGSQLDVLGWYLGLQIECFRLIDNGLQNLRSEAATSRRIGMVVESILFQLSIESGIRIIGPRDIFNRHWASLKEKL